MCIMEVWTFLQRKDNSGLDGFLSNLALGYFGFLAPWPKKRHRMPKKCCSLKCYFGINHSRGPVSLQLQAVFHTNQVPLKELLQTQNFIRMLVSAHDRESSWTGNIATLSSYKQKSSLVPFVPFPFKITHTVYALLFTSSMLTSFTVSIHPAREVKVLWYNVWPCLVFSKTHL